MTLVNAYCTEQEVRDQFGDEGSTLSEDLLHRAINATSRAIDRWTGRRFWQDADVVARTYRPRDGHHVFVHDISTDTGLIVKTDTTGDGTFDTTWDSDDFVLEPRNEDVVATGDTGDPFAWWQITAVDTKTFPVHARKATLQVTARFGWSGIPDEVNQAAIIKAAALFRRKDAPFGVAGFGDMGAVRISRFGDPDVTALLDPYVRFSKPDV